MIKNIIFDIGNVLTDFRWRAFLEDKGMDKERIDRIAKVSIESPLWYEFDRGVWKEEELMEAFMNQDPSLSDDLHLAFDDVHGMVRIRDYAIPWVQELKERGFGVYYLSNFSHKCEVECADSLAFLPFMDGGILSYKEKLVKPDPAIYQLLLRQNNLKAEECIFFDDTKINVEAACKEGIHGVLFTTKEAAEEAITALCQLQ